MITREEIRTAFATLETNEQKAEFCREHMEQERELPELYENLVDSMGRKLFKWEGLYKAWSSEDPKTYLMTNEEKIDSRTTEQMIEDALVNVPEVKEDDVSKVIGEMNEV
jgi:hypothetical protein|tara:strand:- start:163 stop:492 length:330 start_codon:yes stop_codon:yes gene_type:complete